MAEKRKRGKLSMAKVLKAAESGEYVGFCTACGKKHYGVEPDARRYECDECGFASVYGAEELVLCGGC